jgi:hypothetical protein
MPTDAAGSYFKQFYLILFSISSTSITLEVSIVIGCSCTVVSVAGG